MKKKTTGKRTREQEYDKKKKQYKQTGQQRKAKENRK